MPRPKKLTKFPLMISNYGRVKQHYEYRTIHNGHYSHCKNIWTKCIFKNGKTYALEKLAKVTFGPLFKGFHIIQHHLRIKATLIKYKGNITTIKFAQQKLNMTPTKIKQAIKQKRLGITYAHPAPDKQPELYFNKDEIWDFPKYGLYS